MYFLVNTKLYTTLLIMENCENSPRAFLNVVPIVGYYRTIMEHFALVLILKLLTVNWYHKFKNTNIKYLIYLFSI